MLYPTELRAHAIFTSLLNEQNKVARFDASFLDGVGGGRVNCCLHFHSFEHEESVAFGDLFAGGDVKEACVASAVLKLFGIGLVNLYDAERPFFHEHPVPSVVNTSYYQTVIRQ
jgi:hypothetical protein